MPARLPRQTPGANKLPALMPDLSAEQIARVDGSKQVEDVLALPGQLEDALWRVESAGLDGGRLRPTVQGCEALIVCGMGGSAVGGDLARGALGDRLTRPLATVRGYALPAWAMPESVVLCSSYSGNTEETLACYEAAGALGATRLVATTGGRLAQAARADDVPLIGLPSGLQPRAAVAYMLVCVLEVAALTGIAPGLRTEIDAAAAHLEELASAWGPAAPADSQAKQVAERVFDSCACIYGAGPTAPAAYRWKTQINENAKLPAFTAELPEADHNEIVGWDGAPTLGSFLAVFLEDTDQHPRTRRRIELTAELIASRGAETLRIESSGDNPLARLLSLVLLGDLVSIYLAVLRGIDPTPVKMIDQLKAELERQQVA
jgi:glucose/mannose-6-phosphate isomerase